jgi:hypothetical protein
MKNYTDVTVLVDRSGSMQSIKQDMEGAFAQFVKEQSAVTTDECVASLYQFDTECDSIYTNRPIATVPKMEIVPRGMTALYDAMKQVIDRTGERLARLSESERPARVVFVVITDGEENSSRHTTASALKELVEQQQSRYNWQFVYLGANQDAMLAAREFGLKSNYTYSYTADTFGTKSAWSAVSNSLTAYRTMACSDMSFTTKGSDESDKAEKTISLERRQSK